MNNEFRNKYLSILRDRSMPCENGECIIWQGSTLGPAHLYGRMKIKNHEGVFKNVYIHRLSFALHNNWSLAQLFGHENPPMSHICHNSLCVNAQHISIEPMTINNARKGCKTEGLCLGHDQFPPCLIDLVINWYDILISLKVQSSCVTSGDEWHKLFGLSL